MRRRKMNLGPVIVWTGRSNVTDVFHAVSGPLLMEEMGNILVAFEMGQSTGDLTARPAIRYSDDGDTWGTPSNIGAATLTADGVDHGSGFGAAPGTAKTFGQLGFNVRNTTNSALEFAKCAMRLDKKKG